MTDWKEQARKHEESANEYARMNYELTEVNKQLLEALKKIAKGEGAYSRDPLTHAGNTITSMKNIATEAIRKAEESE